MEPDALPDAVLRYADHPDGLVDVHLPPGPSTPRPLVFYVHGGFWRQRWDRTHARPLAQALAGEGYVVALPEYRRVGGAGGWPTSGHDVEAALLTTPAMLADVGIQTTTTTLVGHSAGGHLVLWLATRPGLRIDGVVALAPVADLRLAREWRLGDGAVDALQPDDDADPAARLTSTSYGISVVHGDQDDAVPVAMGRSLAAQHPWLDYRELPGVDHFDVIDPTSAAWPVVLDAVRGTGLGPGETLGA